MSAEFEKIVLEKFDDLNSKITVLSKEIHETKEKVVELDGKVEKLDEKVEKLDEKVVELDGKVEKLDEKVVELDGKVEKLDEKVVELDGKVEQQGLNFARFENDFNIKIQGLFDSFVANTESHLAYDKFISALNAKTYNHDIKISVLEDYFKETKLLTTN